MGLPNQDEFQLEQEIKEHQGAACQAVACFPPSFKGQGSAAAEEAGCSQPAWEQPLPPQAWHLGYWNKRKSQVHNSLSRWETNPCVPLLGGQVRGLQWPFSIGWLCTPVVFRSPVPAAGPVPSLLPIHKHCFCPLPSVLHIIPYICTSPSLLIHLPLENNPCLFPFSRWLSLLSTGWSSGGWKIAFVMLAYPRQIKKLHFLSFAAMNSLYEH